MITDTTTIRPRYGEVDKMGYVYHANYVSYCHQARTELMRKLNINDSVLEDNNLMLPVIAFELKYRQPAHYDELLTVQTTIRDIPKIKLNFSFKIYNEAKTMICQASSTVVFVDAKTRKPVKVPGFIIEALNLN